MPLRFSSLWVLCSGSLSVSRTFMLMFDCFFSCVMGGVLLAYLFDLFVSMMFMRLE